MKVNTEKSVGSHGNGNNSEATSGCRKRGKHDANLQKNGFLRFQIGLIVALAMVYLAVELSTSQKEVLVMADEEHMQDTFEYHPELAKKIKIKKPTKTKTNIKKVVNPTEFIIKDNIIDVEPTDVIDVELTDDDIVDVDSIVHEDLPPIEDDIPWEAVEEAPIFPGCEKVDKDERFECFNKKMKKHIRKHFRYPELAQELGEEGRVGVIFKISKDGTIQDIDMRGPSKSLEKEAARIIGKLPKMTPGKQRGRPVNVPFSIPINFKLD